MKVFIALALLLPAFAVGFEFPPTEARYKWDDFYNSESNGADRDEAEEASGSGGEMDISETHQCYVYGQCQEYSIDFSQQNDAEGCHSFCGKIDGCKWWSWEPAQSLCLAFENCTESGHPSGTICPDCISGEKVCPARDCHQAYKCKGHFEDSFIMSHLEECIDACNSNDNCNWYTLEKHHDRCILYEDCELHDKSCDTCATGQKYCSHGLKGTTPKLNPKITAESSPCDLAGPTRAWSRQCNRECGLPLTVCGMPIMGYYNCEADDDDECLEVGAVFQENPYIAAWWEGLGPADSYEAPEEEMDHDLDLIKDAAEVFEQQCASNV